jgi:broad specificity phosphatase PhoE
MRSILTAIALLTGSVAARADSCPAHILIIRHAEKPSDGAGLSPEGKDRAAALPKLFMKSDTRPNPYPTPDFIIAAKNSDESRRPVDTVTPLADKLGLTVQADIKDGHFEKLVKELFTDPKYAGKTVLICWHHGTMPDLAKALKGTDIPDKIDKNAYNLIWQIDYKDGKAKTTQGSQKLMPGD